MDDARIQAALLNREKVLWSGQPAGGVRFLPRDFLLVPFSLLWGGLPIFAFSGAAWNGSAGSRDFPFPIFALLFPVFGLFVIFGRFFFDAWLRSRMTYAVTDQRILIFKGNSTTVVPLQGPVQMSISSGRDGVGTVRFGPPLNFIAASRAARGFAFWVPSLDPTAQFLHIFDAQQVFDLIQRQTAKAQT